MNRTNLINAIIQKNNFTSYCEIGIGTGRNFAAIKCKNKAGVDPDRSTAATVHLPSDDFFFFNRLRFDVIFIDGLHHADQVIKDVHNAWAALNNGGFLLMHDVNPHSENITHVPRDSKEWCGDVYKVAANIVADKFTLKDDYGVMVIKKAGTLDISSKELSWFNFHVARNEHLNLKTWEECLKLI